MTHQSLAGERERATNPHDEEIPMSGCAFDRLDPTIQRQLIEHYLQQSVRILIPRPIGHARRQIPAVRYPQPFHLKVAARRR